MKAGMAVYLHTSPSLKGNIARVYPDGSIDVTWHPFVMDRPDVLADDLKVNIRLGRRRMRVHYAKHEMTNVGFGVPEA